MDLNSLYGDTLRKNSQIGILRGSGKWDPPPTNPQSDDRGPAWSKAFGDYSIPLNDLSENLEPKKGFQVGATGFYTQPFMRQEASQEFASRATHLEPNNLMYFFFSKDNIDYLQDRIVSEVLRIQGTKISRQSEDELLIIMQNFYSRALNGWLPQPQNPEVPQPRGEVCCSLTEQLKRLNKAVLEECVKQVLGGVMMYKTYYKDASSLPMPLTHPVLTTMKGSKGLSERVGMYDNPIEASRAISSYNQRHNIL